MQKPASTGDDDRVIDVHAAEVPPAVRHAVLARTVDGDTLWRCPRMRGSRGLFGLGQGKPIVEWWLISSDGEMLAAFWEA
jgi:hypothetical protein